MPRPRPALLVAALTVAFSLPVVSTAQAFQTDVRPSPASSTATPVPTGPADPASSDGAADGTDNESTPPSTDPCAPAPLPTAPAAPVPAAPVPAFPAPLPTAPAAPVPATPVPASPAPAPGSAAALEAQAQQDVVAAAAQQALLTAATERATVALACYAQTRLAADVATRTAAHEHAKLVASQVELNLKLLNLGDYVNAMYRTSGHTGPVLSLLSGGSPNDALAFAGLLRKSGEIRGDVVVGLNVAEAAQQQASEAAAAAQNFATTTQSVAATAKQAADTEVATYTATVAASTAQANTSMNAAAVAATREAAAAANAAAEHAARAYGGPGVALGGCAGGDVAGFPNGELPVTALCPLWGAPGQGMRADAANAFNAMSRAYGEAFRTPICVSDSYRSYPAQVAVRALKPGLAAVPGTSNHGWGLALDLCGGIQTFGSPQHLWMTANSLRFGFFHPSWAREGGGRPEPWHWEYVGG